MAGSPLEMMNCETASDVRPILSTASTDYEMSIAEVVSQEEDSDPIDQQQMPISTLVQAVSMRSSMHSSRHWQSIDLTNRKESVLITQSSPQQKSQSGALLPVSTRGTRRSPRKQTLYLSPRAAAAPTKILALKNQNLPMPKCGQLDHDANASYPVPISGVVPGANEPLTTPTISTGTLKSSISQPKKVEDWTPPQTLTKTLKGGDNNEPMFGIDAEKPKSPLSNMPGICEPVEGAVASITLEQLVERMAALFPAQKEEGMTTANCVASRLFACFSLYCDTQALNNAVFVPSPRKRPRRQDSAASKILVSLNTILPLLQALVDLEVALLDEKNGESKSRRVHFAAFDGSALQPPSDVMEHSHVHNQAAIDGLVTVLESVDTLRNTSGIESRQLLKSLVDYLTATFDKHGHSFLCAQSMSNAEMKFPVQRVHKAAARYSADFQQLLSDSWWNKLEDFPLSWNCRLADATAQLVRYWLRTELNPVPDRAASQKYSKKWNNRVYNILTLEKASQSTETDTIVNDGSLSSLVSNAASHVCCYFGNDWKEWKASVDATPLDFFELTELCQKGIAPASPSKHRRRSGPMLNFYTADDWERITHHIEVATTFLAAVNRAKFLYDLLTIVSQHSEHQASWHKTIQQSAQKLERCGRDSLLKDDIHLLLLRWSPLTLLDQLPILIDWKRKRSCEKFLEEIPNKFLLGKIDAKKTRRKKAYEPYIGVFEGVYERGMSKVAFPSVRRLHVPMAKSSWLASP